MGGRAELVVAVRAVEANLTGIYAKLGLPSRVERAGSSRADRPSHSPAAARDCGLPHVRVGPDPISLDEVAGRVVDNGAGAVVTFQGFPRDVPQLDYEAYGEMAEERIATILADCVERHGLVVAAAEHRTGAVPAEEASVVVAVSAPHRPEAFEGAREAIDRIKAEAPIWKLQAQT